MAKTKTPFLSLGAKGTVGGVLTSQKRGGDTILRKTPVPTDPYSLAQAYQRWDYRDYAYLWTLLTNSQKQVYRTRASRYHITGFSLWMREHLKELPDLAGRWHLDEKSGNIAYDSSRNTNHGTIFGASPVPGIIDYCRDFDYIDDRIVIPHHPSLTFTTGDFSVEAFIEVNRLGVWQTIYSKGHYKLDGYAIYITSGNTFAIETNQAGTTQIVGTPANSITSGVKYHLLATRKGTVGKVYISGDERGSGPITDPLTNTRNPTIGRRSIGWGYLLDGLADEVIVHNRALDATEAKRHSERRYP